jgi:hypothetical protein
MLIYQHILMEIICQIIVLYCKLKLNIISLLDENELKQKHNMWKNIIYLKFSTSF